MERIRNPEMDPNADAKLTYNKISISYHCVKDGLANKLYWAN